MRNIFIILVLPVIALVSAWAQYVPIAFNGGAATPSGSWTEYQAIGLGLGSANPCSSGTATSCTYSMIATQAGSGIFLAAVTSNNVTSGGTPSWSCGGSWTNGTHTYDSAVGNIITWINTGNTGGCTSITLSVSGAPGTSIWTGIVVYLSEVPKPFTGATIQLDQTSAIDDSSNCGTTGSPCTLAPFNTTNSNALTGTDVVIQFNVPYGTITSCSAAPGSSGCAGTYTSPYQNDYNGNGLAVNVAAGNLTGTAIQSVSGNQAAHPVIFAAAAFTTSAAFTVSPTQIWTQENAGVYYETAFSCSPGCGAKSMGATVGGADNLLLVCAQTIASCGGSAYISSITDSASESGWVLPTTSNLYIGKTSYGTQSCAYKIGNAASVTSVTPTLNASCASGVSLGVYELNKSSGAPVFDAAASTDNSGSSTSTPAGQAVTLTGTDDFCIQAIQMPGAAGGLWAVTNTPYPYDAYTNTNGQNYSYANNAGAVGLVFNAGSLAQPTWLTYNSYSAGSLAMAGCWK